MWPWRVKMPTQNLLRLCLLPMLVMRIVLATVNCRFGSWGLVIKLNFCSDFEHFGQDFLKLKFWRDFEAEVWSAFCRWCFEEVTKLNPGQYSEARFGQVILWYELNPRVRCAFGNVFLQWLVWDSVWGAGEERQLGRRVGGAFVLHSFLQCHFYVFSIHGRSSNHSHRYDIW